jgi:hypothetical protein
MPETPSTSVAPKMDEKQLIAAMEAAAQKMAKNEQSMVNAAAAARRLNMNRFMRLSRKPTDTSIRGFNRQEGHQVSKYMK